MTLDEFVTRALRVPFAAKGRGWDGWDCWGLVVLAYREVYGIDLPTYDVDYEAADVQGTRALGALVAREAESWRRIRNPSEPLWADRPGDVAVLRLAGRPVHVGLVLGRDRFLHAEEKVGTIVERFSSPMWARRLEGVYRRDA